MDDFLTTGGGAAVGVNRLGDVARVVTLFGAVLAIGGAVFAAKVLTAGDAEMDGAVGWVRRGGVLLVVGSTMGAVAQVVLLDGSWSGLSSVSAISDALGSSFGFALALRAAGGVLVAVGAHKSIGPPVLVGIGLVLVSFLFDGHTVSEGPRWLHAVANVVHVSAAATWAGGILFLAWVLAGRRRSGADLGAAALALRFSVVATIALVATAMAGTVLAIVVLDSPSDLWSTSWGQLLIAKVVLVAVAAAGGGYNRQVVIPTLERDPENQTLPDRFRSVVILEAVALGAVTVVTALLIAASSA